MSLLRQPGFDQRSESSGTVPHHLPLGESQLEDDEVDDDDGESDPVPTATAFIEMEPLAEDEEDGDVTGEEDDDVTESNAVSTATAPVENGNGHATSGDLPSDPTVGVDSRLYRHFGGLLSDPSLGVGAPNVAQSAPSNLSANGDAMPSFVALSPSFRENGPIGGRSVLNNLANVNFASHILYGLARSGPLPASSSFFSLSGPSTSFLHLQPWWSGYCLFFEERFSMFSNLPSQYLGVLVRLIEESWYRCTEAERGAYTQRASSARGARES